MADIHPFSDRVPVFQTPSEVLTPQISNLIEDSNFIREDGIAFRGKWFLFSYLDKRLYTISVCQSVCPSISQPVCWSVRPCTTSTSNSGSHLPPDVLLVAGYRRANPIDATEVFKSGGRSLNFLFQVCTCTRMPKSVPKSFVLRIHSTSFPLGTVCLCWSTPAFYWHWLLRRQRRRYRRWQRAKRWWHDQLP